MKKSDWTLKKNTEAELKFKENTRDTRVHKPSRSPTARKMERSGKQRKQQRFPHIAKAPHGNTRNTASYDNDSLLRNQTLRNTTLPQPKYN